METRTYGNAGELRALLPAKLGSANKQRLSLWDSPEALANHVASLSASAAWGGGKDCTHWSNGDESFTGSSSMAAAIALCLNGWPEGAERAARIRDKINTANPMGPRLQRWDVAGAYPSVARALSGNPMNMRRIDPARLRRRPVITLFSDFGVNWQISAVAITNRAAVVAAIVDAIEGAGYACHVIGYERTQSNDEKTLQACLVTVKEPNAPADIGRMAFALGHAAMFRRLTWATITEDSWIESLGRNYGIAAPFEGLESMPDTYVVPSVALNEGAFKTEEAAATRGLAWLIQKLTKQGCPAFPAIDNAA